MKFVSSIVGLYFYKLIVCISSQNWCFSRNIFLFDNLFSSLSFWRLVLILSRISEMICKHLPLLLPNSRVAKRYNTQYWMDKNGLDWWMSKNCFSIRVRCVFYLFVRQITEMCDSMEIHQTEYKFPPRTQSLKKDLWWMATQGGVTRWTFFTLLWFLS